MSIRNLARTVSGLIVTGIIVAACSTSGATSAPPAAESMAPESMAPESMAPESMAGSESPAMTGDEPFGTACTAVPATGAGSFDGMATDPVATAASNNPVLSTLVTAVTAANLGDTLNSAEDITVFAPTNDAFSAMDPGDPRGGPGRPDRSAHDRPDLPRRVRATRPGPAGRDPHDAAGRRPGDRRQRRGLHGQRLAAVVCGNVQTANATVYIIDGVLLPPAS